MISRRRFLKGLGVAALGVLSAPAYAVGIEPFRLRLQSYYLTPPRWPKDLQLTAALIADPHICDPWMGLDRVRSIVAQTNALKPDIILMLGDYVASHKWQHAPIPPQAWADLFGDLSAPLGTHAILGNHDWWDDPQAQRSGEGQTKYGRALVRAGIPLYQNRAVRLQKDGKAFWLAGLDDQIALAPFRKYNRRRWRGLDDLDGTLAQVTDDAPVLLMAHEPDIIGEVPSRVSLTVSGHTHGGQVNCFGYLPAFPKKHGRSYAYGHIVETEGTTLMRHLRLDTEPRHLIVSGGLGCSILPIRFGVPPEITMVHLGGSDQIRTA
ncbi:metallophosphoesterase [Roseibium sediminicola]|uniref:Metallophosphoesterase n=1 Tax=Roseibium sediminicola TaxID=2933272 RepID=A0ABT0GVC6_9HYPH|nr:metallophosphoesterase [Roseibium sp. CAU 1639]MCK7613404.1 metallophosphoesterase [Roseibium sp. CAU 1639]